MNQNDKFLSTRLLKTSDYALPRTNSFRFACTSHLLVKEADNQLRSVSYDFVSTGTSQDNIDLGKNKSKFKQSAEKGP